MEGGSKKAIIAAFIANLGIAIAKVIGFMFTGAASMLAEAIHSFADTSNQGLLLLGGNEGSWNRDVALDRELVPLLDAVDRHNFARAAAAAAKSNAGKNGLARWLFGERRHKTLDRSALRKLLPQVARLSLASPRRINRQRYGCGTSVR